MKTKYGEKLRKFFRENTNPLRLINFEDVQIFASAVVESNILIIQNLEFSKKLLATAINSDFKFTHLLSHYENLHGSVLHVLNDNGWHIGNSDQVFLKNKIENNSDRLKNLPYEIMSGVKTGYNEAFLISENLRNTLISLNAKNVEIIKPTLRGRNLKRYSYAFENEYLIYSHNGLQKNNVKRIDVINDYPKIYSHLIQYKKNLEHRPSKGKHWTNIPASYSEYYELPKIIWGELSDKPKFSYDEKGFLVEATTFLMVGPNLKYILALLNSKLAEWYFNQIMTTSGMGTNRWKKYKIEQLPLKGVKMDQIIEIENLVDQIIQNNSENAPTIEIENEIDKLIYEIYQLTSEEIKIIET